MSLKSTKISNCPPGHFCEHGIKKHCLKGTFQTFTSAVLDVRSVFSNSKLEADALQSLNWYFEKKFGAPLNYHVKIELLNLIRDTSQSLQKFFRLTENIQNHLTTFSKLNESEIKHNNTHVVVMNKRMKDLNEIHLFVARQVGLFMFILESLDLSPSICKAVLPKYCSTGSNSMPKECHEPNQVCLLFCTSPLKVGAGFYTELKTFKFPPSNEIMAQRIQKNITIKVRETFVCPPGYFCPGNGSKVKAIAGTAIESFGFQKKEWAINCAAGFYCLEGSANQFGKSCVNTLSYFNESLTLVVIKQLKRFYCPKGSAFPRIAEEGTYTKISANLIKPIVTWLIVNNFFMLGSIVDETMLSTRLLNLQVSTENHFGLDKMNLTKNKLLFLMVIGHGTTTVNCTLGNYCKNGLQIPCPSGRYGNTTKLHSSKCSGPCLDGYWCPKGTKFVNSHNCGNASTYCPKGSSLPLKVPIGYYSLSKVFDFEVKLVRETTEEPETRSLVRLCEEGYYCDLGIRKQCPEGSFGKVKGQSHSTCSGKCAEGFFCPAGSTSKTETKCSEILHPSANRQFKCLPQAFPKNQKLVLFFEGAMKNFHDFTKFISLKEYLNLLSPQVENKLEERVTEFHSDGRKPQYLNTGHQIHQHQSSSFCFWKKFDKNSIFRGALDGQRKTSNEEFDLLIGRYRSFPRRVFVKVGFKVGYYQTQFEIKNGKWIFYCISTFFNSTTFSIIAEHDESEVTFNLTEVTPLESLLTASKEHFGTLHVNENFGSTNVTDIFDYRVDPNSFPSGFILGYGSTASYGGYTVFNESLKKSEIKKLYELQRYFYPGHHRLSSRLADQTPLFCADEVTLNFDLSETVNGTIIQPDGSNVFCPTGTGRPLEVSLGHYSIGNDRFSNLYQTGQRICSKGSFCVLGKKHHCPSGVYGNSTGLFSSRCSSVCPKFCTCSKGSILPNCSKTF